MAIDEICEELNTNPTFRNMLVNINDAAISEDEKRLLYEKLYEGYRHQMKYSEMGSFQM